MAPTWRHRREDYDRYLTAQLARLGREHVGYSLRHSLNRNVWGRLRALDLLKWLARIQADGRVGRIGFSFHAGFDVLEDVVDAYDRWTLSQIQYNDVDTRP